MTDAALALDTVRGAVSRVLDVDPGVLRADTPLADLGCDAVAMIAIVDVLLGDRGVPVDDASLGPWRNIGDVARQGATVADLLPLVNVPGAR